MIGIYPYATFPEYCAAKAAAHQWVKTMGPELKLKDNVTLNCVMPGAVDTGAMPDFSRAFLPEQMTLRSNLMAGYDTFLDDHSKTGKTMEAAHNELIEWGDPGNRSGAFAQRTRAVFEPWFELIHGEKSYLPGAITDYPCGNLEASVDDAVDKLDD
jgi:NAD(P)-dependent dehydrogenase (short-subunit alcohol dehydrogenase family)